MVTFIADINGSGGYTPTGTGSVSTANPLMTGVTPSITTPQSERACSSSIPIAICGMSVRLPGGIHSPQQLWEFLLAKQDARGPVPKSRYNASAYLSNTGRLGSVKTDHGYFLDDSIDIASIDTSFFNMGKAEVERMDPHQRQMLEVARECVEDAGVTNWRGRSIGCYMGSFGEDWVEAFAKENQQYGLHRVSGYGDFVLANRVSYEMDLTGPSITVRTACSASLVALNEACSAVAKGDCEGAIVGGANLILGPGMTAVMSEQGVLSPDGRCKTFSADANGYARGEAISAIFIKPLDDALRDGNPVRAVIRATATNSDGRGRAGMQVPDALAQEKLMRHTYRCAGITDFSQTAYVECHGTGTPVGDPIEADAVGRVFGPHGGVLIGSVKSNLGHSEGASGLTSVIKSVLALENRIIPPSLHCDKLNPAIPWKDSQLSVPTDAIPWPESRSERISVNSFGIGGSNAHVVLDSARSFGISPPPMQPTKSPQLLVYSATTAESLKRMITNYEQYILRYPDRVTDLAFTLANKREHLPHRAYTVVDLFQGSTSLVTFKQSEEPNLAMIFTGQGAQWAEMGRCMFCCNTFVPFQHTIRSLDAHLQTLPHPPTWSIEEELQKPAKTSRLSSAEISQPLCTAIQIALVDTFASIGVEPTAVIGHSSGEIAAAYAAGAIQARDAIEIAFYRGYVTQLQTKSGSMAAIGMGAKDVDHYLQPGVIVACENSPRSVTISGDTEAVESAVLRIKKDHPNTLARLLKVDKAYHSHHMAEIGAHYRSLIQHISTKMPQKLFFSSVEDGKLVQSLGADYWQKNLESPVLFRSAVLSLLRHDVAKNLVFMEVGPHAALEGPLRQIQAETSNTSPFVSTFIRSKNDVEAILGSVGKLHSLRYPVDLRKVMSSGSTLPDLPRYPWDHSKRYWYESRLTKEWRNPSHKHHNLLGTRVAESTDFQVSFRNLFHMDNAPWMRDHKIGTDILFPFAGYAEMIGEAVSQLGGSGHGFTIRRAVISMALVLQDNGIPVEIITTMRRYRLTESTDSDWWEFSIASHNGANWTKHCFGEAKSVEGDLPPIRKTTQLPRRVPASRCYTAMARAGLNYGPTFQRLSEVHTGTTKQEATAQITTRDYDTEDYHLHPSIIDASLQLFSAAATKGYANTAARMMIPTRIDEITIMRCHNDLDLHMSAQNTPNGSVIGKGECVSISDGKIALRSSGVRLSCVQEDPEESRDGFARLEWGPHIDFMDVASLIKVPNHDRKKYMELGMEMCHLCMIHSSRTIESLDTPLPHMHKYRDWIRRQIRSVKIQHLEQLESELIEYRIDSIFENLKGTKAWIPCMAIRKIFKNLPQIFTGETEALDCLLADDTLTNLYAEMDQCDTSQLLNNLAHRKPNMRILEIGAGTGGTTTNILSYLKAGDRTLYSKYTFTDISAGFFPPAKEHFSMYPSIEYATLDITKDPSDQGFDGSKYDLIIASNVIHATPCINTSLLNLRKLLEPSGHFILTELTPTQKWVNYIWGVLPGWWCGEADGRTEEPYITGEQWRKELMAAGFRSPDAIVHDVEEPYQLGAVIVARQENENLREKRVTLLGLSKSNSTNLLQETLERRGYTVDYRQLNELPLPAGQDVIAVLDDDASFFVDMDSGHLNCFKKMVEGLKDSRLLWVTGLSQIQCKDPQFAQINGIARSIRLETLVEFGTCEVDDIGISSGRVVDVFEKYALRLDEEDLKMDYEYVILNDVVHVGRFHSFMPKDELLTSTKSDDIVLRTSKPGRLGSLHWSHQERLKLKGDDVEVEIYATGLNFKDVLCAMDIVESQGNGFGLEAAGLVRRTGPGVADLDVGDRVMILSSSCFSTSAVVSENVCERIPSGLSFEDAATMPCVFATAVHSIMEVGNLRKGQSILIHSACGGVGLAAIQLAQMIGAEIYATVGSDEKTRFLVERYGLSPRRIFNSRDTSFAEDIMEATDGEGVDLALSSLSGELLHATWACVAEFGKMVDISKRDAIGFAKLDMAHFMPNRSYSCVDLDHICRKKPTIAKRLLKEIGHLLRERYIHPIRPIKVFEGDATLDAFRYMQQGVHLGKIVVAMRDSAGHINIRANIQPQRAPTSFDKSGAYLLIGGLGGIGRSVSTWMAARGARHLIHLSPSAGTKLSHCEFAQELSSMGCHVDFVRGDVSSLRDVIAAVARAEGRLKGIMQMCMALDNQTLDRMTPSAWNHVVDPKVRGTWNLHNATVGANCDLDFFVMFSSISGVCGQPGQTNYAGANTFLDAFSQFRLNQGLPACAIQVGAVEEVGFLAENDGIKQQLKASGALPSAVSESEVLTALELAVKSKPSKGVESALTNNNICLGLRTDIPLSDPDNRLLWKKDCRMGVFHNGESSGSTTGAPISDGLKSFIVAAKQDATMLTNGESAHFLALEIGKKLFSFLLKPEEDLVTWCSLGELGMDSLVAIEVRQWWRQIFEFDISVLEMLSMGTLDALGELAAKGMLKTFHGDHNQTI